MSPVDAPARAATNQAAEYGPAAASSPGAAGERDAAGVSTVGSAADAEAPVERIYLPGIGEPLPLGERLLWTGSPTRRAVARRVGHVRAIMLYFGALIGAVAVAAATSPGPWLPRVLLPTVLLGGMAITVLAFAHVYSALVARSSVYAITDRRVVFRIGVAIPAVLNIPLDRIESVDLRRDRDGTGDVTLALAAGTRIAFLLIWPHTRPWRLANPEPAFRGIPDAAGVGTRLAEAIRARLAAIADEADAADPTVRTIARAETHTQEPAA